MAAFYNEIDTYAADWLENLIAAGHIAPGVVDRRDVRELKASDLEGFTQCHFFAGIGVWSYALRRAGWPDDRPVWTGSCPCQPFSNAGRGEGHEDPRHLWPTWFRLIRERDPVVVLGEQVASADGLAWLDLVSTDMEATGHAFAAVDLCAAGVGAPHIRQRLFFLAYAHGRHAGAEREPAGGQHRLEPAHGGARGVADAKRAERGPELDRGTDALAARAGRPQDAAGPSGSGAAERTAGGLADAGRDRAGEHARELHRDESEHEVGGADRDHPSGDHGADRGVAHADQGGRPITWGSGDARGLAGPERDRPGRADGALADAAGAGLGVVGRRGRDREEDARPHADQHHDGRGLADAERPRLQARAHADLFGATGREEGRQPEQSGHGRGFWADAEWVACRDGKARPVEPGSFPLAYGLAPGLAALRPVERRLAELAGLDARSLARARSYRVSTLKGLGNAINAEAAAEFVGAAIEAIEEGLTR